MKRARIIGTAALVVGICNMTDTFFVTKITIGAYNVLYIAAALLFLYCVNYTVPEKRI